LAPVAALTRAAAGEWSRWALILGSRIDDRDPPAPDDVAQRAREGERARIVGKQPSHAGHDLIDAARPSIEAPVERDIVAHARKQSMMEPREAG